MPGSASWINIIEFKTITTVLAAFLGILLPAIAVTITDRTRKINTAIWKHVEHITLQ